jgi:hypothetical protein
MPHLFAVLVLAGPALAHAQPARASAVVFKARLRAPTHRPEATRPWRYVLRVTDPQGHAIRARARFRIVFAGPSAPPPRELGRGTFRGRYAGTYRWPRATRGEPLVFQAIVTARGAMRTLRYWIRVR